MIHLIVSLRKPITAWRGRCTALLESGASCNGCGNFTGRLKPKTMGRSYAGMLGPLAFALVIARGAVAGWALEPTLLSASAALFVFAAIGYLAGQLAEFLVNESVRMQFQAAMAAWETKQPQEHNRTKTQPKLS